MNSLLKQPVIRAIQYWWWSMIRILISIADYVIDVARCRQEGGEIVLQAVIRSFTGVRQSDGECHACISSG